jgi:hypothetical protein
MPPWVWAWEVGGTSQLHQTKTKNKTRKTTNNSFPIVMWNFGANVDKQKI